jgi:hypothetical protein
MMHRHRLSYVKTTSTALALLVLIAAGWFALSPLQGWVVVLADIIGSLVAVGLLLVGVGGILVLIRDRDIQEGRRDLFARANATRSEAALLQRRTPKGFLVPRIWRALGRHSRPVVGELVRVKSLEQIRATLDASGSLGGLPFMPEMHRYCGQQARVYRYLDKVYDYGGAKNLRRMNDAVLLCGLRCDGSEHGGCQAECYLIWKACWLETAADRSTLADSRADDASSRAVPSVDRTMSPENSLGAPASEGRERYTCQFTSLVRASSLTSMRGARLDLLALLEGNVSATAFAVAFLTGLFNRVQRLRSGVGYPFMPSGRPPPERMLPRAFQPGDSVRICSREAIAATLDVAGRSRGLWFDLEMVKHCRQERRVGKRVERIIDVASGKMLRLRAPCSVLTGVQASGEFLSFCPQEELIFWREEWLEPVTADHHEEHRLGLRREVSTASHAPQ